MNPKEGRQDDDAFVRHPDLAALGKRLRTELDETLRAEQHAARVSAQRRSSLRDRVLLAEDRAERLELQLTGGTSIAGLILAVGADHTIVAAAGMKHWVALQHIVTLRTSGR